MKKNIIHVISGLRRGGAEISLVNLVMSTSDLYNHYVVICTPRTDRELLGKLSCYAVNVYVASRHQSYAIAIFENYNLITNIINTIDKPIIVSHLYWANFVTAISVGAQDLRHIAWIHNFKFSAEATLSLLLRSLFIFICRFYPPEVIVPLRFVGAYHRQIGLRYQSLHEVGSFILPPDKKCRNLLGTHSTLCHNTCTFLIIARAAEGKGLDRLVQLCATYTNIQFTLCTTNFTHSDSKHIRKIINTLIFDLDNCKVLQGEDPLESLPESTYLLNLSEAESYSNVIVEALSHGKPILTTKVGIARAGMLDGAAFYISFDDPDQLAQTILSAADVWNTSRYLYNQMSIKAFEAYRKHFHINNQMRRFDEAINSSRANTVFGHRHNLANSL